MYNLIPLGILYTVCSSNGHYLVGVDARYAYSLRNQRGTKLLPSLDCLSLIGIGIAAKQLHVDASLILLTILGVSL